MFDLSKTSPHNIIGLSPISIDDIVVLYVNAFGNIQLIFVKSFIFFKYCVFENAYDDIIEYLDGIAIFPALKSEFAKIILSFTPVIIY
jgi:hypothetical protein